MSTPLATRPFGVFLVLADGQYHEIVRKLPKWTPETDSMIGTSRRKRPWEAGINQRISLTICSENL